VADRETPAAVVMSATLQVVAVVVVGVPGWQPVPPYPQLNPLDDMLTAAVPVCSRHSPDKPFFPLVRLKSLPPGSNVVPRSTTQLPQRE